MRKQHYTPEQLDEFAIADLLNDAVCSERQVADGEFYPENGVTRESLLQYAADCRSKIARYSAVGAHKAVLVG